jgi:sulfoxide reductase heme-binding subunit YedZ
MSSQVWWYVARSSGIVAWGLITASVVWGLLLSTRLLRLRPSPRWLLDLHRYLGGLAVVFTGFHIAGLVADSYTHFDLLSILVPMASQWRPGPVAWGVVGLYLLGAVEITSLMMDRIPRRVWHGIHLLSYGLFWVTAIHGATAGTDAANPWYVRGSVLSIVLVLGLTLYRVVIGKRALHRTDDRSTRRPPTRRVAPAPARRGTSAAGSRRSAAAAYSTRRR